LQFASPEWIDPFLVDVEFNADQTIRVIGANTHQVRMRLDVSTGRFSGSFLDPRTRTALNYHGVLDPNEGNGVGYFLTPHNGGWIRIVGSQL
jgi:hypothetical protein